MTLRQKLSSCYPAGPRLRCFLGGMLLAISSAMVSGAARPQLETNGPIHLTSVEGHVVDSFGKAAADLNVTLSRDNKVLLSTHTDQRGDFRIDKASGDYLFQVERSKDAPAARQVIVRMELVTLAERKKLYVILGPGACTDACSSIFTSKQDFNKALRKLNKH